MIDMDGAIVHMWAVNLHRDDEKQGVTLGQSWYYKYLKNHHLLVNAQGFGIIELDWDSQVVWQYRLRSAHHDFARLDNGNTLILFGGIQSNPARIRDPQEVDGRVEKNALSNKTIYDDRIIEVKPTGEIVWEWRSLDHYDDFNFSPEIKKIIREHGGDWLHTNTIDALPDGNILICFRHLGTIAIIDKATGKVTWKWNKLVGPHHPSMTEHGNILVYDNGYRNRYPYAEIEDRDYTRLVEVDPRTSEVVWEYHHDPARLLRMRTTSILQGQIRGSFHSKTWGSAQRLPNGNTLSLDANRGRLFEITRAGEIVWEYINPYVTASHGSYIAYEGPLLFTRGVWRCYRICYDDIPGETSSHD
jgi:hypothetical protein